MSSNKITIAVAPTPIVLPPKYITSYTYSIVSIELFSKIIFDCKLFDADGIQNPLVFQNIVVDQSNNPILPSGYIVDNIGSVRDSNGVHIVIVI